MSEAKFTKGVWSVGRKGSVVSTESDGITINGGTGEGAIYYYGGNLICESVSENNVNLLAAAPELYGAAVKAIALLESLGMSGSDEYQELFFAIARSEG